ncbi:hypothetical protein [Streptomyces rhizosphaerihabitans]|uniref:hypothetical protein n=1 Tax=Streptomyces rhizosphaerihabitans TaxID=1266770 RepID=UPI0021BEA9C3|nr:hypothetical protein [Streptomyces rhizosphaerihabitans]MCT9010013.1 hypothetical protein [Streptomyces rhizosphaerihabitans]
MSVKGAFTITLSGPREARTDLLKAFATSSIAARRTGPDRVGLDEEAKGWVEASFHEGTDSPSSGFQQECMSRTTAIAERFGYELRSQSVTVAGAAEFRHVVDTRTGAVVVRGFGLLDDGLPIIAEEMGIPVEYLEFREPPGVWDIPEK